MIIFPCACVSAAGLGTLPDMDALKNHSPNKCLGWVFKSPQSRNSTWRFIPQTKTYRSVHILDVSHLGFEYDWQYGAQGYRMPWSFTRTCIRSKYCYGCRVWRHQKMALSRRECTQFSWLGWTATSTMSRTMIKLGILSIPSAFELGLIPEYSV